MQRKAMAGAPSMPAFVQPRCCRLLEHPRSLQAGAPHTAHCIAPHPAHGSVNSELCRPRAERSTGTPRANPRRVLAGRSKRRAPELCPPLPALACRQRGARGVARGKARRCGPKAGGHQNELLHHAARKAAPSVCANLWCAGDVAYDTMTDAESLLSAPIEADGKRDTCVSTLVDAASSPCAWKANAG